VQVKRKKEIIDNLLNLIGQIEIEEKKHLTVLIDKLKK